MLENMFIGRPPGNYDRLLDFSRTVTGNLFFVPSATFLDAIDQTSRSRFQRVVRRNGCYCELRNRRGMADSATRAPKIHRF